MNRSGIALAILLVAGCSFPEKHGGAPGDGRASDSGSGSDAAMTDGRPQMGDGGGPFGCIGQAFPTAAPPQLVFTGSVVSQSLQMQGAPLPNVPMQLYSLANGALVVQSGSDQNGNYNFAAQTQGTAIDGYIEVSPGAGQTNMRTYLYPRQPFHADQPNVQIGVYDQATVQEIYAAAGVPYSGQDDSFLIVIVDCNGAPVAGAQLVPQPGYPAPGGIRYLVNNNLDPNATMTDASGEVIALGVQPGTMAFSAKSAAGMFHVYQYNLAPTSVVYATIQP